MTAQTATKLLRERGPLTARALARTLRTPLPTVYTWLVAAESRNLVRINVDRSRGVQPVCTWEAMS